MKKAVFFIFPFFCFCKVQTQIRTPQEDEIIKYVISILEREEGFLSSQFDFFFDTCSGSVGSNYKNGEETQIIYSEEFMFDYTFAIRYGKDGNVTRIVAYWDGFIVKDEDSDIYGDYVGGGVVEIPATKLIDQEKIKFMSFLVKAMNISILRDDIYYYRPYLVRGVMPDGSGSDNIMWELAKTAELFDWPYLKEPYGGADQGILLKKYLKK